MINAMHRGVPVSKGIAIGPAYRYQPTVYHEEDAYCSAAAVPEQLARLRAARAAALSELDAVYASFDAQQAEQALIFAAHKELLSDEELLDAIEDGIESGHRTAESAVFTAFAEFTALLSRVEDPTIASRVADLCDVRNRLLRLLHGDEEKTLSRLPGDVIVVAHDLLPSDTATLDRAHVRGILTEVGGATSHSAILARSMNIPAVLGAQDALSLTTDGELLILDAVEGGFYAAPDEALLADYRAREADFCARRAIMERYLDAEPLTRDGRRIQIGLNIGSDAPDDGYRHVDFVGLFRSEFLYMESDHLPTEAEQFEAYRRVLLHARGKPVTLRTLDIGGDKQLPYLPLPQEDNPFLGCRALRLCLSNETLFRTQLRAAYRASTFGALQIMFPMVGSMDDFDRAKAIALSVREELAREGVAMGGVPLGIMIEIPSIAMVADQAAREVDFASIGTNDLCQYLCAADRMNASVSACYQPLSPAMLRMLKRIIDAFAAIGTPLSVCGEMGGDPQAALLLVGMGLQKLSMSGSSIAAVKEMLSTHTLSQMEETAIRALSCRTERDVRALLAKTGV